ncbi:hypothetical protein EVJ58_g9726 [Rhodofomes roseus]|uniref:Uncharacterized protein n=1 Tax=Rhodofomes roseus TaxID=34475 RepID=A0A4Y9XS25_9APHY|nr:hypothetical protein EVJ58_g9726 [Rhodofomes roseus]
MPKGPSPAKEGNARFGVDVKVLDSNGKPVYQPSGKPLKHRIRMGNVMFHNETPQTLYYPDIYPQRPEVTGRFKGMAQILTEQYPEKAAVIKKLRAECGKFQCPKGQTECCCRQMLFVEKDFTNVKSLMEVVLYTSVWTHPTTTPTHLGQCVRANSPFE